MASSVQTKINNVCPSFYLSCVLSTHYQLLSVFHTVDFLENTASGVKYSSTHGCNLGVSSPSVPKRKKLCPNKAKGTGVCVTHSQ